MSSQPSTAREALLAELLGDVHQLLERVDGQRKAIEEATERTAASARALQEANAQYRSQLDESIARTRKEFAATLAHASSQAITQQTQVLQDAATTAIRQALTSEAQRQAHARWWRLVGASAAIAAVVAVATSTAARWLAG